jgi:hypothetical protein
MNDDATIPSKPRKLHSVLNVLLMFYNILMGYTLCVVIVIARRLHVDPFINQQGVYPGSQVVSFFLRNELLAIPILLIAAMILKEFKVKIFKKRVYINLLIMAAIHIHLIITMLIPHIDA